MELNCTLIFCQNFLTKIFSIQNFGPNFFDQFLAEINMKKPIKDLSISDFICGALDSLPARRIRSVRAFLLASYFFYASGKTTTISGLPMQAAAVGAFPFVTMIPALMVMINCAGSHIIILHSLSR